MLLTHTSTRVFLVYQKLVRQKTDKGWAWISVLDINNDSTVNESVASRAHSTRAVSLHIITVLSTWDSVQINCSSTVRRTLCTFILHTTVISRVPSQFVLDSKWRKNSRSAYLPTFVAKINPVGVFQVFIYCKPALLLGSGGATAVCKSRAMTCLDSPAPPHTVIISILWFTISLAFRNWRYYMLHNFAALLVVCYKDP